jgi:hypothetical protein
MKFKIGDTVQIAAGSEYHTPDDDSNPIDTDGVITQIQVWDLGISVRWDNGWDNSYNEEDLEFSTTQTTNMSTQKTMKTAVRNTADNLLTANNTVTTLEIKNQLRKTQPNFYWSQATVSALMDELQKEGVYTYTDNGTFRVYSALTKVPVKITKAYSATVIAPVKTTRGLTKGSAKALAAGAKAAATRAANKGKTLAPGARISRSKALELMKNNKGHFFTAVFTKVDGTERTINAQYLKDQGTSGLGYVKVREASKLKAGTTDNIRQINMQTLKRLKIQKKEYVVS